MASNTELEDRLVEKQSADRVEIVYYTDPLCCWSWAFEPQWRKLRYQFGDRINWRYRMGGLIPDWKTFSDPINSVSRPSQMGPMWMQSGQVSGMPVNDLLWLNDPPLSSYPACIAVKCAELQSRQAGELYLRKLREATMVNGLNIEKLEILTDIARRMQEQVQDFSVVRFTDDLKNGAGLQAFKDDLQQTRYHSIGRFPTLTMKTMNKSGVIIVGYRPYQVLLDALNAAAPGIVPVHEIIDEGDYISYWGALTNRELEEAMQIS